MLIENTCICSVSFMVISEYELASSFTASLTQSNHANLSVKKIKGL